MPRVSEAHLAARRRQILDAAGECFARTGFHATSMQDVIRAAGLSVGAVYRYFPSKDALIAAIAEEAIGSAAQALEELSTRDPAPDLGTAMAVVIDALEPQLAPAGAVRIAIGVWAEALRDAHLATLVEGVFRRMRDHLEVLATRLRDAGRLPTTADPAAVASALFSLLPGYALQRALTGTPDRVTYTAGIRSLLGATGG